MHRRAVAVAFLVVAMLGTGVTSASASASPSEPTAPQTGVRVRALPEPPPVPSLRPALVRAGLQKQGTVVRQAPGLLVTRVDVGGTALYRVRVAGAFPPRALRYVVSAGGSPVGYGIPTPAGEELRT